MQIKENPYFQFFIGLSEFSKKAPFAPSMMVYFRKLFDAKTLQEINEVICGVKSKEDSDSDSNGSHDPIEKNNQVTLIADVTCTPTDIRYPTDYSLLNDAREKLGDIIDSLYEPFKGQMTKPRTYRKLTGKII